MATILALETSGAVCSVAVAADGSVFAETEHVDRRHNDLLLPMVERVLETAGVRRDRLDAVAFSCGPGSFTGVRIAAAACQGLALSLDALVVPVPSSKALAQAARPGPNEVVLTSIRSRADLHYLAAFRGADDGLVTIADDVLCASMAQVPETHAVTSGRGVGSAPGWWEGVAFDAHAVVSARDVLTLALERFASGDTVDAALALPRYLAGDTPWRKLARA
jgi:tRNA threonylcarbamoyladenosine biosynthesis protein TsaB